MSLIKCPECGREVSDRAPACIHCGFPLHSNPKTNEVIEDSQHFSITLIDINDIMQFVHNAETVYALLGMTKDAFMSKCKQRPAVLKSDLSLAKCEELANRLRTLGLNVSTDVPNELSSYADTYAVIVTKIHGFKLIPIANTLTTINKSEPKEIMTALNHLPAVVLNHLSFEEASQIVSSYHSYSAELKVVADKVTEGMTFMPRCGDGVAKDTGVIRCPRCGSTSITTGQRGYKLSTGFLGSNKTVNRCAKCGHKWEPSRWD